MTRRKWIYPSDGSEPFEVSTDYTAAPSGPLVIGDLPSYQSPIDGRWIDGRVARREDLARHGCRPWEGIAQERKESARHQGYESDRQDRRLQAVVEQSIGQISEHSRRTLLNL
jgi:hypothetical protein